MDYNFHSRILLADTPSKHILIILVTDSQNFKKLQEFERDKNKTLMNQQATDQKIEFMQDQHFETSEFHIMDWGYYK